MDVRNILALLELQVSGTVPPIEVVKTNISDMEPVPQQNILAQMEIVVPDGVTFQLLPEPDDEKKPKRS